MSAVQPTPPALTEEQLFRRCVDVLHETFSIPKERITLNAHLFNDLDLDSIDAVDLIVRMKPVIGRRLSPDAFQQVRTVKDVVVALHTMLNQPPTSNSTS